MGRGTVKKNFFDYFQRGFGNISKIENLYIGSSTNEKATIPDTQSYNLFSDCFGHHVKDHYTDFPEEIKVIYDSNERLVSPDQLTAYFMTNIYSPPKITKLTSDRSLGSVLDFDEFLDIVTNEPIHLESNQGTNNINFLIGEAGEGKTLFCNKVQRSIYLNEKNKLDGHLFNYSGTVGNIQAKKALLTLPLYIDFEQEIFNKYDESENLDNINFSEFVSLVYTKIKIALDDIEQFNVFSSFKLKEKTTNATITPYDLNRFFKHLRSHNIRIFLTVDNLDRYYFYYSKHIFFQEHRDVQEKTINKNITGLIEVFTSSDISKTGISFSDSGLCVLFVTRGYVYDYLVANHVLKPIRRNHYAFKIENKQYEILDSRMRLYNKAVSKIVSKIKGKKDDFNLEVYRKLFKDIVRDRKENINHIQTITEIGRQGNRSFIDFISSLKVLSRDNTLIDRFIVRKQRAVIMLYIINTKDKFTQIENHFPNIFLNDSTVCSSEIPSEFLNKYKPHLHTYWLKYFILKFIKIENTNLDQVLILFNKTKAGYPKKLIKLALGSLNTDNDFKCIRLDEKIEQTDIKRRTIRITDRGKYLLNKEMHLYKETSSTVEFCFNFLYLQLMIDDYLLSFPKTIFDKIFLEKLSYSYLLLSDLSEYKEKSIEMIKAKAKAVLYFIKVLKASLYTEQLLRKEIFEKLEVLGVELPNFIEIESAIMNDIKNLRDRVYKNELDEIFFNELDEILNDKQMYQELVDFFHDYYTEDSTLVSVKKYESD